jgi:hypothetical protein
MNQLENGLVVGIFFVGFALILASSVWLLPFAYDYRISLKGIEVRVLGIMPVFSLRAGDVLDVGVENADTLLKLIGPNPLRTLRLGNRITKRYVIVTKKGLVKYVIFTPKNIDEFCNLTRSMIGTQPSSS